MADIMLKLKKKYDEKKIGEIENDVEHYKKHANSAEKSMVETLHYLETTERFKENQTYKDSKFDVYVKDRFCITPSTYHSLRIAFHNFRDEAVKYGAGVVAEVQKKCGAKKVKKVFDEIKAADKNPSKPITRKKMDVIVKQHTRSRPKKKPPEADPVDWKAKYAHEHEMRLATEKELEKAKDQINRLKDTVRRLKAAQVAVEQAALAFRNTEEKQLPS